MEVEEEPIVAIILGGRSKFAFVDSPIILDGSKSYDPNLKGDEGKVGLTFKWSCKIKPNVEQDSGVPCLGNYFSSLGMLSMIK